MGRPPGSRPAATDTAARVGAPRDSGRGGDRPRAGAPCPPRGDAESLPAWAVGSRAAQALLLEEGIILPGEMRKIRTTEWVIKRSDFIPRCRPSGILNAMSLVKRKP